MKQKFKYHRGIECLHCHDRLFSMFVHDCRTCKCDGIMVDGGFDYFRCGWNVSWKRGIDYKFIRMKIYATKKNS